MRQRPSAESVFQRHNQPDSHNNNQLLQSYNHPGDGRNTWSSRSTISSPADGFGMAPQTFLPAITDAYKGKQHAVGEAEHSEAMEDDNSKLDLQSAGSEARRNFRSCHRPSTQADVRNSTLYLIKWCKKCFQVQQLKQRYFCLQSEDNMNKSTLMKKLYASRKRQHQHRAEKMDEGEVTDGGQSTLILGRIAIMQIFSVNTQNPLSMNQNISL